MIDKQITNEIDISKCEFCEDSEYCYIYSGAADFKWMCKENEDCQIKNLLLQLKTKEQECERLKEAIDGLLKIQYQLADSCTKYEQTLTEIKEIAKKTS